MSPWYTGLDLVTVTKGKEECGPGVNINQLEAELESVDQSEAGNATH